MVEFCQRCGEVIASDAEANVWEGQYVVCTPCVHELKIAARQSTPAISFAGSPGAAWYVNAEGTQIGPYETDELINLLSAGDVDYNWLVWRDGMTNWRKVSQMFTIGQFTRGLIALREHGQGDGTYRPSEFGA
jgi:hypothetical protein